MARAADDYERISKVDAVNIFGISRPTLDGWIERGHILLGPDGRLDRRTIEDFASLNNGRKALELAMQIPNPIERFAAVFAAASLLSADAADRGDAAARRLTDPATLELDSLGCARPR